ncbi:MAG TPA: response regulator, partial [Spirochaetia bacterium]|nr:response regulator [Spirochaetia bacterium]
MTKQAIPPLVILIVDDDDFLRKELTSLILHDRNLSIDPLVRENIRILYARNGAEALSLLQQKQKVNLILLDIMMPIMDGYEICKILRRNPEFSHCVNIPIFFISGAVKDSQEQLRGIELEADEVFSKPFDPLLLGSYIKKELKRQIAAYQHELERKSQRLIGQLQERAQKQNIFHFVSSHTYS